MTSYGALRAVRLNSSSQRNAMLVAMPWRRQISATATPGLSVCAKAAGVGPVTALSFMTAIDARRAFAAHATSRPTSG